MAHKREHLSQDQIRQRVDAVMAEWNNQEKYPDSAALLEALRRANGDIGYKALATQISEKSGHYYTEPSVYNACIGINPPPYALVEDLLASNALNLDPARIQSASADKPAGDQRVALFTKAELIEVTPESIQQFNRDVLAGVQRQIEAGRKPHWVDIIRKLLDFHTQGNRPLGPGTYQDALIAVKPEGKGFHTEFRLQHIIQKASYPNDVERQAFYRLTQLDDAQVAWLERMYEQGRISSTLEENIVNDFSRHLDRMFVHLRSRGYSAAQVATRSIDPMSGEAALAPWNISEWRTRGTYPSLDKMRSLVQVLEGLADNGARVLQQSDIDRLVELSGFKKEQFTRSAHDVIRDADVETTPLSTLLQDIRNATDINVSAPYLMSKTFPDAQQSLSKQQLQGWENENKKLFPNAAQVGELMRRYSLIMQERGSPPLDEAEISKVVRVMENSHHRWEALGQDERHQKKQTKEWRKRITTEVTPQRGPGIT